MMEHREDLSSPLDGDAVETVSLKARLPRKRTPWLWILAGAVLVFLAAGAGWFIYQHLNRIVVHVSLQPEHASLAIDGKPTPLTPDKRLTLQPRPAEITAIATGYVPWNQSVDPRTLPNSQLVIELTPAPSFLSVSVNAPGATVTVGERAPLPAPVEGLLLEKGSYAITATAEGYLPESRTIDIPGGGTRESVAFSLTRSTATLAVSTVPAGAELYAEGHFLGTTPIELDVQPGSYRLFARIEGYKDWTFSVTVDEGEDITLPTHTFELPDGSLAITSTPAGAAVIVGGKTVATTPAQIDLRPGTHTIHVARDGYAEATLTTAIQSGITSEATVTLSPLLGKLTIHSVPNGATVYSGDQELGRTPLTVELPATEHAFTLRRPGFVSDTFKFAVRHGLELSVTRELVRDRQLAPITAAERQALRAEDLPNRIETATGYPLRLVHPGTFTMGAGRDDPHRAPDEASRDVTITYPFYIGEHEVSNLEFRSFRENFSSGSYRGFNLDADDRPAVNVSWDDAARYCNWLSSLEGLNPAYAEQPDGSMVSIRPFTNGYRLPTEAEWEYAAQLAAGTKTALFPWGSDTWPAPKTVNLGGSESHRVVNAPAQDYEDLHTMSAPVRSYPPDKLGLYDIAGNVSEWCHDWYSPSPPRTPEFDPQGPEQGTHRVVKGSSWQSSDVRDLRIARRKFSNKPAPDLGFRIVRPITN